MSYLCSNKTTVYDRSDDVEINFYNYKLLYGDNIVEVFCFNALNNIYKLFLLINFLLTSFLDIAIFGNPPLF